MTNLPPVYILPEQAEAAFDRSIAAGESLEVAIREACQVAAAYELRQLVATATALGAGRHYLSVDVLTTRAHNLDPSHANQPENQ